MTNVVLNAYSRCETCGTSERVGQQQPTGCGRKIVLNYHRPASTSYSDDTAKHRADSDFISLILLARDVAALVWSNFSEITRVTGRTME